MNRVKKFLRHAGSERWLLIEALGCLCWVKAVLLLVPFRWIAPRLGRQMAESPSSLNPPERELALRVSWAVQAVSRHVPLGFVCLPQAMAAKWMLRRRGLPTTLYLGLRRGEALKVAAHAWLRAGDKILTGAPGQHNHQVIATFAEEPAY